MMMCGRSVVPCKNVTAEKSTNWFQNTQKKYLVKVLLNRLDEIKQWTNLDTVKLRKKIKRSSTLKR
jgi:hypothetical protein